MTLPPRSGVADVALWHARLEVAGGRLQELYAHLSPDERTRAARFVQDGHRSRFVAARGLLRELLAGYLAEEPSLIAFCYGPEGKPALADTRHADVAFNVSHSGGRALFAFARGVELGVDLELIKPRTELAAIACRFFSPVEVKALLGVPEDARPRAFFSIWTRKEAYLKARGLGLALPLSSFDVSLGEPAALLRVEDRPRDVEHWTLTSLAPAPGFIGALAVSGPCQVKTFPL